MKEDYSLLLSGLYRNHFGKMVSVLMYHTGIQDIAVSEDVVQEAFAIAAERWSSHIPENPEAWLYKTIRNIAYNSFKKERQGQVIEDEHFDIVAENTDDRLLSVLFACVHPDFPPKVQLIIALRYVSGLQVKRIAALLASTEESISKILYRWRSQDSHQKIVFREVLHFEDEQKIRMILKILYAMFTEGYRLSETGDFSDETLCEDALSLLQVLMKMEVVANGEVKALYALMLYNLARASARLSLSDGLTVLAEQNRNSWDKKIITVANNYLLNSQKESSSAGVYQLEAAIAYVHASALSFENTNWIQIGDLYEKLVALNPSPFTKLSQAAALYFGGNESDAMLILNTLKANKFFQNYHLLHCFLGKIAHDNDDFASALAFYQRASNCPVNIFESKFIRGKILELSAMV